MSSGSNIWGKHNADVKAAGGSKALKRVKDRKKSTKKIPFKDQF